MYIRKDGTLTVWKKPDTSLSTANNRLKKAVPARYTKLIKGIFSIFIIQSGFPQTAFTLTAIKKTVIDKLCIN